MGYRWEVYAYRKYSTALSERGYEYRYEEVHRGNSMLGAFWAAAKAKRTAGCVKVEWR